MIVIVVFTVLLLVFGSIATTLGVSSLLVRYKDGPGYNKPSYSLGIFITVIGLFILVMGIIYPFVAIDSEKKQAVFTEQCHNKGGSVVENVNNDHECWKERIEL